MRNWQSPATHIYFCVDLYNSANANTANLATADSALITDGFNYITLPIIKNGQRHHLVIPLSLAQQGQDYFIVPIAYRQPCEDDVQLLALKSNCELAIVSDQGQLPMQVTITQLDYGTQKTITLSQPYYLFSEAPAGQCQFTFTDMDGNLLKTMWHICDDLSNKDNGIPDPEGYDAIEDVKDGVQRAAIQTQLALPVQLIAYPNPTPQRKQTAFQLINPVPGMYTILITDASGRLVQQDEKFFNWDDTTWQCVLPKPGAYLATFTLNELTLTQTVIVK